MSKLTDLLKEYKRYKKMERLIYSLMGYTKKEYKREFDLALDVMISNRGKEENEKSEVSFPKCKKKIDTTSDDYKELKKMLLESNEQNKEQEDKAKNTDEKSKMKRKAKRD